MVTDIRRDGTMTGPNLDLLRDVCARTDAPVVASGGVSTLDDVRALATLEPASSPSVDHASVAIAGSLLYIMFIIEQPRIRAGPAS